MPVIIIDEPDDPRIAAFRDVRERDLVGRDGMFVAEGRVVLEKLVGSAQCRPVSLLIAAKRVESLAPLVARLPDAVPVFVAAQPVIDAIAGFPLHRGILAIGERVAPLPADALLADIGERGGDILVLMGIANHDNMGGIFRNAAAFGIAAVLLDATCCDPLYRKAIRVSVGAALLVPFARLTPDEDPVALVGRHGFVPVALSPTGACRLADFVPAWRNALFLGAEGPGLPGALIDAVASVRIDMAGGFDSLNVATTSGIVAHHLSVSRPPSGEAERGSGVDGAPAA
ncbi:MAG TPA: RNA methyltransferase [Sphingomonas sp.]|jgi:tRNA G18 (ribose-2'-O)-methylase SpoU|nr:RNA methyltransferase [Sphingomonas sp.]